MDHLSWFQFGFLSYTCICTQYEKESRDGTKYSALHLREYLETLVDLSCRIDFGKRLAWRDVLWTTPAESVNCDQDASFQGGAIIGHSQLRNLFSWPGQQATRGLELSGQPADGLWPGFG